MKIKILESIASTVEGAFGPGEIVDWKDEKEAKQLIKSGVAEPARATKKKAKETASVKETSETASLD
tara:strand:- start:3413 stop:3613 length:201 start_codon:yes stop_codon:yes gene_type:complete